MVERGGRGYVQRPYMYHGHEYARRSYYYHGGYYHNYYGRYYYRGVYVNPYYPAVLLRAGVLRLGLQSVGRAGVVCVGLGRQSLVRILRRLLHALPGVCQRIALADGLHDLDLAAGGLSGAGGTRPSRRL